MVDKTMAINCRSWLRIFADLGELKKLPSHQLTQIYDELSQYNESLYELLVQLDTCFVPYLEKKKVENLFTEVSNLRCSVAAVILIGD